MSEPPASASSPWLRIKEHKVLQWSLAYLGAALALAHGQELVGHAFHWPDVTSRIVIGALIVGFPLAVAAAWYHGHKGLTRISAGELTVVSVMLLVGAGVLMLLVRTPAEEQSTVAASTAPTPAPAVVASAVPAHGTVPIADRKKPRLAILPFDNLSPDPENAFFTDGLHEEILATLAQRAPGLEVISRTTMMIYRQKPKPLSEMARELGATHVIEGSVRRDGKQVRLTLQLIDASTDDHVWAQNYDRTLANALTLQTEVASEVASQLSVRLTQRAGEFKPPTQDPKAYDLFLKALLARNAVTRSTSAEVLQGIQEPLDGAIALDPAFAAAYAQRAVLYMLRFTYGVDTSEEVLRHGRADLATAERLAPGDPNVLNAKAQYRAYMDGDPSGALTLYEAAETAGLADPLWLYLKNDTLSAMGRMDDAIRGAEHAMALDPRNPYVVASLATLYAAGRRPVDAARIFDFGIEEFPDEPQFGVQRALLVRGYTGSSAGTTAYMAKYGEQLRKVTDPGQFLMTEVGILRYERRFGEMAQALTAEPARTIRGPPWAGEQPLAEPRGWTYLFLDDRVRAAAAGREILDFLAHRPETKWNRAYQRLMAAEAHLFVGDRPRAVASAREVTQSAFFPYQQVYLNMPLAGVYAWAGYEDEAVAMLERLSTELPATVPPASIARDPFFALPLAHNARYRELAARIEAEMRATKLE
jgi:TolB-like protein